MPPAQQHGDLHQPGVKVDSIHCQFYWEICHFLLRDLIYFISYLRRLLLNNDNLHQPGVEVDSLLSETSNSEALRGCDQAEQLALGHAHLIEHTDGYKGKKNKFQLHTTGNFKSNTEENYLSVVHVSKKALKVPAWNILQRMISNTTERGNKVVKSEIIKLTSWQAF